MPHVVLSSGRRVPMARVIRLVDSEGHERTIARGGDTEPLLEDQDVREFFLEQDEDRRLAEGGGVPEPVELRARRRLQAIAAERRRLCGGGRS